MIKNISWDTVKKEEKTIAKSADFRKHKVIIIIITRNRKSQDRRNWLYRIVMILCGSIRMSIQLKKSLQKVKLFVSSKKIAGTVIGMNLKHPKVTIKKIKGESS